MARDPVHNPFFHQPGTDAHNAGAVNLAGRSLRIHYQSAILNRHHLAHSYDARFHINFHFRHLNAGRAKSIQPFFRSLCRNVLAHFRDAVHTQLLASLLPG